MKKKKRKAITTLKICFRYKLEKILAGSTCVLSKEIQIAEPLNKPDITLSP
jgi:hypothetical protein